jgi:hypothetical protein
LSLIPVRPVVHTNKRPIQIEILESCVKEFKPVISGRSYLRIATYDNPELYLKSLPTLENLEIQGNMHLLGEVGFDRYCPRIEHDHYKYSSSRFSELPTSISL